MCQHCRCLRLAWLSTRCLTCGGKEKVKLRKESAFFLSAANCQTLKGGEKKSSANLRSFLYIIRTLIKTRDYLELFARFKEKENIEAVERLLSAHTELELFERSQLGIFFFFRHSLFPSLSFQEVPF